MNVDWKSEYQKLLWGVAVLVACFALPVEWPRFNKAVFESLALLKWYAQEHVLLCLVPGFFIAGAIGVFVGQASVMRYLGAKAPKALAYGVASVSGTILAVCSCTVLPLFAGIWRMGAGLGPACAFLYSGPAINVLAIILTARILGLDLGVARAVGAILFGIVIGIIMHVIYRKEETAKAEAISRVTDAVSGNLISATAATYLYGLDAKGRPTIAAFADKDAATERQHQSPGHLLNWERLRTKELATRCGFCDRAVYPEDSCSVKVAESTRTCGCCVMCGLGVAARLQKDIEMEAKDALTGDTIKVQTLNGSVASLEPKTAVAWAGGKKGADGTWASTGCFKQAFFVNEANLKTWLEKHPSATGRMVTIGQALASKMKMTPAQIAGACKIGECK